MENLIAILLVNVAAKLNIRKLTFVIKKLINFKINNFKLDIRLQKRTNSFKLINLRSNPKFKNNKDLNPHEM